MSQLLSRYQSRIRLKHLRQVVGLHMRNSWCMPVSCHPGSLAKLEWL